MLFPAKRGAWITSRGQSVLPWFHIRILGAVSAPCLLHSHNWMYIPLLVLQIVVLDACWQGLQQPHGPAAASQGCAYSREQPRQGDFRLSILVGKQSYNKAWGDPHKQTQMKAEALTFPWNRLLESSKDDHGILSHTASAGQCFALPLVLPVHLTEKPLGSRCKYTPLS